MVGRSLEMDLAEDIWDTWSEVSLGSSGMSIVVVESQRTYLIIYSFIQQKGDRFQEAMMIIYSARASQSFGQ